MYDIESYKIAPQATICSRTERCGYAFGSLSMCGKRCWYIGLHSVSITKTKRTFALGAGSFVPERNRQSLSAGVASQRYHKRECKPSRRRALGDGRRAALQGIVLCNRRNLGRSACAKFYGNKAACDAGRSEQGSLLAGAARGLPRSQCCAEPMAHRFTSLAASSARSTSPRCATLAGRTVPLSHPNPRHMGGRL